MGIWEHADFAPLNDTKRKPPASCIYCETQLRLLDEQSEYDSSKGTKDPYWDHEVRSSLCVCDLCGWWSVHHFWGDYDSMYNEGAIAGAAGVLRHLDLRDISVPAAELRTYLLAKYSERFQLNPRKFEDIVGGVFRDFGLDVVVTSYSGDDGVDIVALSGAGDELLGVQVKRYRNRIEAEQIRAFAGALVLRGLTQGVFITTSSFRSGALTTAEWFHDRGLAVELWDGRRFLEALRLTQRPRYTESDDASAPYFRFWQDTAQLPTLHSWCDGPENG